MTSEALVSEVRTWSLSEAKRLGYPANAALPYLDLPASPRREADVVARALCLSVASACAYGFARDRALQWLTAEHLLSHLTAGEHALVSGARRPLPDDRYQIEAIWALLWALSVAPVLDFGEACPNTTVKLVPDLRVPESSANFRSRCSLRPQLDLLRMCDLAYLLDWSMVDASLRGRPAPGAIPAWLVRHRRWALEWLLCDAPWDQIEFDT